MEREDQILEAQAQAKRPRKKVVSGALADASAWGK
jgi:hypothetical protein